MPLCFDKSANRYKVTKGSNGNYASYSKNAFGKYAKEMAEYTDRTGIKLRNYYKFHDDYVEMIIYSKKRDSYDSVLFDIDKFDIVSKFRWYIETSNKTSYARTKDRLVKETYGINSMFLHSLVMDNLDKKAPMIDHINNSGLDNRRDNLRYADAILNNRNKPYISKNSVWRNVFYSPKDNAFVVTWADDVEGRHINKSFSINDYGYKIAKHKAIMKSIEMRLKNRYILTDEDIKYLHDNKLFIIKKKGKRLIVNGNDISDNVLYSLENFDSLLADNKNGYTIVKPEGYNKRHKLKIKKSKKK